MSGLETALVTNEPALRALAPAWEALWRRCPAATPFQHPAFLLPWWRTFHPGALRVVVVRAGDDLVGLAPLYLEEGPHGRRLLPLGISLGDYLDCLVDPARTTAVGEAIADACRGEAVHWEALAPGACALALPVPPGARDRVESQDACPVLVLPEGADLGAALPSGKARKLRMARHRGARRDARIETAAPDTGASLMDHLVRLHGARWTSRGEPGVLADALVQDFHALAWPGLLAAGLLRLHALHLDGHVAGVYYGFAHGSRAYAYLGGFDPAFAFESPGTLLIGHAIAEALGRGAREFHFLRGQETYKYEWGAVDRWNSRRVTEPDA